MSLITKEMQIKSKIRYHCTPLGMVTIEKHKTLRVGEVWGYRSPVWMPLSLWQCFTPVNLQLAENIKMHLLHQPPAPTRLEMHTLQSGVLYPCHPGAAWEMLFAGAAAQITKRFVPQAQKIFKIQSIASTDHILLLHHYTVFKKCKLNPSKPGTICSRLMGMWNGAMALANNTKLPQEIKTGTTLWFSNPTSGWIFQRIETQILKRLLSSQVNYNIIHNNQDTETAPCPFHRWLHKEVEVPAYIEWDITQHWKRKKPCHLQQHGWTWKVL